MKKVNKNLAKLIAVGCVAGAVFMPAQPKAEAFLNIVIDVINGLTAANETVSQMKSLGNNPAVQNACYNETVGDNPEREVDQRAVMVTDEVMNQLIIAGDHEFFNNSLPFRWKVVPSNSFNASCNITDFIVVNDHLVQQCDYNKHELAAVLGHEMSHGYNQHGVKIYKNKATMSAFSGVAGTVLAYNNVNIGLIALGVEGLNFLSVKNNDVKHELAADREGFYNLCSAGFNPGGTCAMLARMKYFTNHVNQFADFFNPNDHPDTEHRQEDNEKLLGDYGMNHAAVKDIDMVYFDKQLLLRAEEEGGLDQEEMAYLIVGGIAKGFHDNAEVAGWNFRTNARGEVDFLDDNDAYGPLKRAIARNKLGDTFRHLVEQAYANDQKTGAREKCAKEEIKRKASMVARREQEAAKLDQADDKVINGNTYLNLGLNDLAVKEYQRAQMLQSENPLLYSGLGRIESAKGNHAEGMRLANKAIQLSPDSGAVYTARALIYKNMGDLDNCLNDCNMALAAKNKDNYALKVAGDTFIELDDHDAALAQYAEYKKFDKSLMGVPEEYKNELN